MKIEICEQVAQSWLRHIKKCQIAQTNWSISPLELEGYTTTLQYAQAKLFVEQVQQEISSHSFKAVLDKEEFIDDMRKDVANDFCEAVLENLEGTDDQEDEQFLQAFQNLMHFAKKKNADGSWIHDITVLSNNSDPFKTFLKQCEIDAVGIELDDGEVKCIYLMDTAFHSAGLNYSGKTKTEARVTKKLIKFIATADVVFGIHVPIRIIFAAPVCKPTPYARIDYIVENIIKPCAAKRPALGGLPTNIEIELCCNDKFSNDVYIPLKNHLAVLNNDNELFLRALNMAKAAEEALKPPKTGTAGKKTSGSKSSPSKAAASSVAPAKASAARGSSTYTIELLPDDKVLFKQQLLVKKQAKRIITYKDGSVKSEIWHAGKFSPTSDLGGNILSQIGHRTDKDQIEKVVFEV